MPDAEWRVPADEVGERSETFEALLVPGQDEAGGLALAASALRFINDACNKPPPRGPGGHLWYREAPSARIPEEAPANAAMISMRIGGYVDDEWLVTGLLLDFSRLRPDLCIRVQDQDGEFLLIEAADDLPTWIRPENAVNRVWLCNGHLHIVPLEIQSPGGPPDDSPHAAFVSVEQATATVRDPNVPTRASARLEGTAFARINFPAAALTQQHTTLAYLPVKAANLLAECPQLVADAVHELTSGDLLSMRAVKRLDTFPVSDAGADQPFPPPDTVLVQVHMTRPLYAELVFSRFFPPRAFGKRWQQMVEEHRADSKDPRGRWADTGAKLTAGLEIYADTIKTRAKGHKNAPDISNEAYERFIAALTSLGYFGSETRGSARWKELEHAAMETARHAKAPEDTASDSAHQLGAVERGMNGTCSPLDPRDAAALEDSEDWLSMVPEQLEGLHDEPDEAVMGRLSQFMSRMGDFVNAQGDVEGAMFDDDEFDDGDEEEDSGESESEERPNKLSAAERERRMAGLVQPLDASEWGEKAMMDTDEQPSSEVQRAREAPAPIPPAPEPAERLQGLSKVHYDGASDSEESLPDNEDDLPDDRAARAKWLEVDDDPGEDVAMDAEMGDFLDFARQALGLSEEQYAKILAEREARAHPDEAHGAAQFGAAPPAPPRREPAITARAVEESSSPTTSAVEREDARKRAQAYEREMAHAPRAPNPALNSFDAVLGAMEAELETARQHGRASARQPAAEAEAESEDELTAEDAELLQKLVASGDSIPESLKHFADSSGADERDVEMLGNFLESFKAQGAEAGPVGTLLQRLGVGALPRDTR